MDETDLRIGSYARFRERAYNLDFGIGDISVRLAPLDCGLAPARFTIFWNMMHHVIFLFHPHKRVFKSHTGQSWIFKRMLHLRTSMLHPGDVGCSAGHNFVSILSYKNHNHSKRSSFIDL